jgi:hypothetical protein
VTLFFARDFSGSAFLAVPVFLAGVTASFWDSFYTTDLWECLGVSRTSYFY